MALEHGGDIESRCEAGKVHADESNCDRMERNVVFLMLISLGGCLPDNAKDMATCRTEAEHFYHMYKAVDPNDPSSQYIIECMAAKGYDFTPVAVSCDSRYPLPTQPACYASNSWPDWVIDQIRHTIKSE